jgi:uncharacterized protein (TIGR02246 family)
MKHAALCAGTLALIFTTYDISAADPQAAETKALKENEARWNQEYAAKDLDKIAAHYANDAVLMAPGMPHSSGTEAIRKALQEMIADPALSLKFEASKIEVAKSGDMAYTHGSYTMRMTDPSTKKVINDHGTYVTVYRKQPEGSWKAVADIATSETMGAPPSTQPGSASKMR